MNSDLSLPKARCKELLQLLNHRGKIAMFLHQSEGNVKVGLVLNRNVNAKSQISDFHCFPVNDTIVGATASGNICLSCNMIPKSL